MGPRIGLDLVSVDAVQASIAVHGDRYLSRTYTADELRECLCGAHHRLHLVQPIRQRAQTEEIGAMIEGELSDPRISFAYVTQVVLNPGGKSALIYVAVDGGVEEEQKTIDGLMAARGYIRHELLERMGVRHIPELTFHIDRSEKMKARIEELLGRQRKRQKDASSGKTDG